MVVNQKEADVYPHDIPYMIPAPLSPMLLLSELSAFKNLSKVTTPETNK